MKSQKFIFQKSQKLLTENLHGETPRRLFRTFNFIGGLCNRRTGFCPCRAPVIFEKWPFAISANFTPFWLNQTFVF